MKNNLMRIFLVLSFIGVTATFGLAQTYPNPSQQETNEWRRKGPCNDPWVSKAVSQANASVRLAHGFGNYGECDVNQYNYGSWNSYDQLYKSVEKARDDMRSSGTSWESYTNKNGTGVFLLDSSFNPVNAILSHNGSTLIGNDTAGIKSIVNKLVAAGGGNLVAAGGGNFLSKLKAAKLVGNDGASLVAAGGGNLVEKLAMSNFAGALSINKIDPTNRILMQTNGAKKYFKVGTSYYVIR